MSSPPPHPVDVPPYQLQTLLEAVIEMYGALLPHIEGKCSLILKLRGYNSADGDPTTNVKCAQALGAWLWCTMGLHSDLVQDPKYMLGAQTETFSALRCKKMGLMKCVHPCVA
jgi:hypothetical protein